MTQVNIEDIITSTFIRYEGIIVCVIRLEFELTNKGGKKRHVSLRVYLQYFSNAF